MVNFRDAWQAYSGSPAASPSDLGITAFLLQHGCDSSAHSIASVGAGDYAEICGLNALLGADASFTILDPNPTGPWRIEVGDLIRRIEREGYASRIQVADLNLPGRWAKLLPALAATHIGVLMVDARWVCTEPRFWQNLRDFIEWSPAAICLRGALDYRSPDVPIQLFRGMPASSGVEPVAATPTAIWLAKAGAVATRARELLRSAGMFCQPAAIEEAKPDAPVVVDAVNIAFDEQGRIARLVCAGNHDCHGALEFGSGWSSPENDGRWTEGAEAVVTVNRPSHSRLLQSLVVTGNAWVAPNEPGQVVEFGIGRRPKTWSDMQFDNGSEIHQTHIQLEPGDGSETSLLLRIRPKKPSSPSEFGGPDTRILGYKLRSVALFA